MDNHELRQRIMASALSGTATSKAKPAKLAENAKAIADAVLAMLEAEKARVPRPKSRGGVGKGVSIEDTSAGLE